jgi:hypothetical protein
MKRSFYFLSLLSIVLVVWECYETMFADHPEEIRTSASLSDIAQKVRAIPLQFNGNIPAGDLRNIRIHDNNLFLISRNTLYRFDASGRFVCRITDPRTVSVASFLVDEKNQQLIVLANENAAFYYTFDGKITGYRTLAGNNSGLLRIRTAEICNNNIYTAEERIGIDPATGRNFMEIKLVKYDTAFNEIENFCLLPADLPGKPLLQSFSDIEIGVESAGEEIYASSAPLSPQDLLADSLTMDGYRHRAGRRSLPVYPLRIGKRFYISSYSSSSSGKSDYIYCFDRATSRSWLVNGIEDDFYRTGTVNHLEVMDKYSRTYCFHKSGEEVRKSFPEYADVKSPVVFVVSLLS